MTQQFQSRAKVRLDPLQAIKRAFMYRGLVVGDQAKPKLADSKAAEIKTDKHEGDKSEKKARASTSVISSSHEPQAVHEKLIDITVKAQDILFKADTIFPFTLFPDTVTLDREKLTVATRHFFRVAKIVSVPVSSISSAEADVGPFFGSLHMASKFFVQNTYSVNFLARDDAVKMLHLLQGFIIAHEKGIDVTDIEKDDLLVLLDDLGQGVPD